MLAALFVEEKQLVEAKKWETVKLPWVPILEPKLSKESKKFDLRTTCELLEELICNNSQNCAQIASHIFIKQTSLLSLELHILYALA